MIKDVNLIKEIVVTSENKMGVLANITKILADKDINIEGVAGYAEAGVAKLMFVTNNNLRATDALKKAGYTSIKESEAVMVDLINKPGALKNITAKLFAEGVDIKYAYGTISREESSPRIILSTSNNEKAFVILKSK